MGLVEEMRVLPDPQEVDDLVLEEGTITAEKLRMFLPKGSRVKVDQATVELINKLIDESACHKGLMEERLMSHLHLMGPGIGFKQVLNAVQFVTLITTPGMTQAKAYALVFPDKTQEILERGGDVSSFASQYAGTKVPTTIMQDIQIGPSITYAPLRHQLVEKLLNLINGKAADGPASATVQLNATIALMDYIKIPEAMTINLNHGAADEAKALTQNLADQIENMAAIMARSYQNGKDIREVQKIGVVIDAELADG